MCHNAKPEARSPSAEPAQIASVALRLFERRGFDAVTTHEVADAAPITMKGGTTFHFVTDCIHAALQRAKEATQGKDVRLGGGVAAVRQYLTAGLIDEIHLVLSPVLLGRGEHLFTGLDAMSPGYKCTEHAATDHVVLTK